MDSQNYDHLDVQTLKSLMKDPSSRPEVRLGAFGALKKLDPDLRQESLVEVMHNVLQHPEAYEQDLLMSIVEIFATDPDPEATAAMLDLLPSVLEAAVKKKDALSPEFREYFYQALVTRSREGDLEVWADVLPKLSGRTLVAAMVDPVAKPLEAIEPMTLIDRLGEPHRTSALISVLAALAGRESKEKLIEIAQMVAQSHDAAQLERGVEALEQRWQQAGKAGRESYAEKIETILGILDTRPRTGMEKIMGKRPWAS